MSSGLTSRTSARIEARRRSTSQEDRSTSQNRNQIPQQREDTIQDNPQAVLVDLNQLQEFITNQINLAVNTIPQNESRETDINPTFALTPALVDTQSLIDYRTTDGKKLFKTAIESLPIKFDMESSSINTFNELLHDKSIASGWTNSNADILMIPDSNGNIRNLIREFGRLTVEEVRTHCSTYIRTRTRLVQHDYQMYECLMNSLTESARAKITSRTDQYEIDGAKCGPLLYRYLLSIAAIDTRATMSFIRENLANLDAYMTTVNNNVIKFNAYVRQQLTDLQVRGGVTHDLMNNLWKAYQVVSDNEFNNYIKRKKDIYDDGTTDLTEEGLMVDAENKYKTLIQENKWNSLSTEQNQIVALTSKLKRLKESRLKFQVNKVNRNRNRISSKTRNDKRPQKSNVTPANNFQKRGKVQSKKETGDKKWAWKKIPPKSNESDEKLFEGTKYYWCDDHKLWTLTKHTDENCNIRLQKQKNINSSSAISNEEITGLAFAAQLRSIMEE